MAVRAVFGLILVPTTGASCVAEPCAAPASSLGVAVAAVEARLELRLDDGRLVRLAGLDPALPTPNAPDLDETARAAFAALIAGRPLGVQVLTNAPDRWGRIVARVWDESKAVSADDPKGNVTPEGNVKPAGLVSLPPAGLGDLATAAIAAGLGRYRAEPTAHPCRAALLAAEDQARAQKLGLWADPYYAVLTVDDRAGFAERAGTLVIAEGRLASVERGPYRSTLIFTNPSNTSHTTTNSHGSQVLSATIPPRAMKIFEARGVQFSSLTGRSLRLRGLLDLRFGPQIELADPDDVELLGAGTMAEPARAGSK